MPKAVGQFVKNKFNISPFLSITKLLNDKWLTENLNTPFRSRYRREGISVTDKKTSFITQVLCDVCK
ncbi:hypothetical protein [Flavicella sp.]|uniref:hypothetical protein n=1 Tax=Flavicella sp. TaxID=2957742 RepID=UPI00301809C5